MNKPNLKQKQIRGLQTAWLEWNDALTEDVAICLHGFPDTPLVFESLVRFGLNQFCVVAPFQRGVEPSQSGGLSRVRLESQILDWLEILRQPEYEGKKVLVLGHDLGAVQAWELASKLGPRLKGVVVFNGVSLWQYKKRLGSLAQVLRSWYIPIMQTPFFTSLVVEAYPKLITNVAHKLGARPQLGQETQSARSHKMYQAYGLDLLELKMPTRKIEKALIIWGLADPFLKLPSKDEFLDETKVVDVRLVSANHWVFVEKPAECVEFINTFLKGNE